MSQTRNLKGVDGQVPEQAMRLPLWHMNIFLYYTEHQIVYIFTPVQTLPL